MELDELKQFHATFFEEGREHVKTLEERLLELETRPEDQELLNALFRAAHSIKGSSGILGFDAVTRLTHAMENVLDGLRAGHTTVTHDGTSQLLEATDLLSTCLEAARTDAPPPDVTQMVALLDASSPAPAGASSAPTPAAPPPNTRRSWTIVFRPRPETFGFGINPALVLRELRTLGEARIDVLLDAVPPFAELDPEKCYLGWRVEFVTDADERRLREVFLFVEDMCDLELTCTQPAPAFEALPSSGPKASEVAPGPAPRAPTEHPKSSSAADASTLRVSTEKVDKLVNLVGELVISQAMISRSLLDFTVAELPRLRESVADMERHTRELQDRVMNIRMVPIGSIFGRFRRLVRDLSVNLGKEIQLVTVGEETELDKSMVELLADPLTHLVRNAADHGLEGTDARVAAGKARAGRITLSARHQGGNVIVDVADDGKGLETARIRAKAVERGLIAEGAALSDEQVHELIFAPGFSTAEAVTGLSGRGVGMDVVKRAVDELNGHVAIATTHGQGTRVRLTVPLTLAILDGMAVRVGGSTFVLPLNQVVETLSLQKGHAVKQLLSSAEVVLVRGEALPLLRLGRLLSVADDGAANTRPLAVVLEAGNVHFAMLADELMGKSQYVIKNLEPNFQKLDGLLGATILGDGAVSFILDVQALARLGNVRSREDREQLMQGLASSKEALA